MKKLTAGIFASILGLTAIGAADAAVPSTKYVDDAVAAAQLDIADTYATKTALETEESARAQADLTLQGNIDAVSAVANAAATKAEVGTPDAGTTVVGMIKAVEANGYDDTAVRGLISGNTNEINTIKGEQTTQNEAIQELQNAGYITNTALTGYATEQWVNEKDYASKTEAQGYANAKDTAISAAQAAADNAAAAASTADGKAVAAQTAADNAAAAASAADTKAGNAQTAAENAAAAAAANATAIEGKLSSDTAAATYELKANVSGAPNDTEAGKYVLTKIVTQGEGGVEVVSYGWELIDRDYSAQ